MFPCTLYLLPLLWTYKHCKLPAPLAYSPNSEALQQEAGILVQSWPIVLGCDASGTVVEVGEGVTKFKVGDEAFGCTRLGEPEYGTFQEFVSVDLILQIERASTDG